MATGSGATLGQLGVFGNANLGNSKEAAYVNVATGNLVLQDQDDFVASIAGNIAMTRTYNAQGSYNDGNGNSWSMGLVKQITNLTGTANTAGSTVTRIDGDGSAALYTFDVTLGSYVSSDGAGGYHYLTMNDNEYDHSWKWAADSRDDPSFREIYDALEDGGRIFLRGDFERYNYYAYQYDDLGRLTAIVGAGDALATFEYDTNNDLSQIQTFGDTGATTRTHYAYDNLHRLTQVITDLSPDDNSIADGKVYTTTYSYSDNASNQVARVTQSDGTTLSFTYVQVGGVSKIASVQDGLGQTTLFAYAAGQTTVTDPLGNRSVYTYDATGQLLSVTAPAVGTAPAQVTTFSYDAKGNVLSVTDARNQTTSYSYDANGNRVMETNPAGDVITRSYDPVSNNLLSETRWPEGNVATVQQPSPPALTTSYVYNGHDELRFVVSPTGRVREYTYDDNGLRLSAMEYADAQLPAGTAFTQMALINWAAALPVTSTVSRTDYSYDARGLVSKTSSYVSTRPPATAATMPATLPTGIAGNSNNLVFTSTRTSTVSSPSLSGMPSLPLGTDLQFDVTTPAKITASLLSMGLDSSSAPSNAQSLRVYFDINGIELRSQTGSGGAYSYPFGPAEPNTTYTVQVATQTNGQSYIKVYKKGADPSKATRLDLTFSPGATLRLGASTYNGPSAAGGVAGATNSITVSNITTRAPIVIAPATVTTRQYVYDAHGQLLQSIDGNTKTSASYTYDGLGRQLTVTDALGNVSLTTYDDANNRRQLTLANGLVTQTSYDAAGNLTTTSHADANGAVLSVARNFYDIDGRLRQSNGPDGSTYFLYDAAGRQSAKIDTNGNLTAYYYNADNQITRTIQYARPVNVAQLRDANGNWRELSVADLGADASDANNRSTWDVYDSAGRLSQSVDPTGALTSYEYDHASRVLRVNHRATRVDLAPLAGNNVPTSVAEKIAANDQITRNFYDTDGNLVTQIDPAGYVTERRFDAMGRLIETIQHINQLSAAAQSGALSTVLAQAGGIASHERYFYNFEGQLAGTLDNANYLTELKYDLNGNVMSRRHYGVAVTNPNAAKMADLGFSVNNSVDLVTSYTYTTRNQLETETAPGGLVTRYAYDKLGRLTETRVGSGTTRARQERYDLQGNLTAELSAEGVAALDVATATQVEGIWQRYATHYTYNGNGLRLSATDPLGNKTLYYYDAQGKPIYTINAAGEVTGLTYTVFGQVDRKTSYGARIDAATLSGLNGGQNDAAIAAVVAHLASSGADSVTRYEYDGDGHQTAVVDAMGNRSTTHYDAFGQVDATEQQSVPNANVPSAATNPGGRNFYDLDGRLKATLTAGGSLTAYTYDALNQLTDRITYAKPVDFTITSANLNTLLADPGQADPAQDSHQRFFYDARGLVTTQMQSEGVADGKVQWSVTKKDYDANGNLIRNTAYATLLPTADAYPVAAAATPSGSDSIVVYAYDSANRLAATATAQNTPTPTGGRSGTVARIESDVRNWSVVRNTYDALGNLSATTAYATPYTGAAPASATLLTYAATAAGDATTFYTYDNANRVKTTAVTQNIVNGKVQWAITGRSYDIAGNLSATTQYATAATTSSASVYPVAAPVTDPARDRTTTMTSYDGAGRLLSSTDAEGTVSTFQYDAKGNLIQSSVLGANRADDRVVRTVYDLDNRPQYDIDSLGGVTEHRYDAQGNVAAIVRYATPINAALVSSPLVGERATSVQNQLPNSGDDRVITYVYDQNQRLRFTIDGAGYLTENRYDTLGRVTQRLTYPSLVPHADNKLATLTAAVASASVAASARGAVYAYDAQGNVMSVTDKLGFVEKYTYDALGRKLTYTNQLNNVWTYTYDGAGRVLTETAPAVNVYPTGSDASTAGPLTALVTSYVYDALGNLISRTEAKNTAQARTTSYAYDLVGHQVRTTQPALAVYNAAATADATGRTEDAAATHSVNVTYDMLGNAVANTDVGGATSYKVYDKLGRVRYDVDAMGYVTGYERNEFGDVTKLTRYNDVLPNLATFIADASARTLAAVRQDLDLSKNPRPHPELDRVVSTSYDQMGRATKVSEPQATVYDQFGINGQYTYLSARTTETRYNAFGDTVLQSVYGAYHLGDGGTGKTSPANTRYYFDQDGRKKAQINVLREDTGGKKGYLTTYIYDGAGNMLSQLDSATATTSWNDADYGTIPAGVPADRQVSYVYDAGNRKVSENHVQAQANATFGAQGADIVTSYAYDATGNLTQTTDANGMVTINYYDALGRLTGIAEVASVTLSPGTAWRMPITELRLDAYGNTVVRVDYAMGNTATGFTAAIGTTAATRAIPSSIAADDRVTLVSYDLAGHATKVTDAEGNVSYNSYDVYGRLAKHWQTVTNTLPSGTVTETAFQINTYDQLGHLINIETPGNVDLVTNGATNPPATVDTIQRFTFNAFGEVTTHVTGRIDGGGVIQTEKTEYDNAGHAWRSNAGDGVTKVTMFDAQGNATVIMRSSATGADPLKGIARASDALIMNDIQRTDTRYDLLGHVVDVNNLHGNDLYYLYRQPDGSWAKDMLPPQQNDTNSFLVIGEPGEASNAFAVQYRLQGSDAWMSAPSRVQRVNGYTVFSISGLTSGSYEYQVTVTPVGEPAYTRDGGQLTIQSATSSAKAEQLIRMYRLILGRAPDAEGLANWMGRLNDGGTMAQVAEAMLAAVKTDGIHPQSFGPGDSNDVILSAIYQNAFGVAPDPQSADYKNWLARMNLTVVTTAVNPQNSSQIVTATTDNRAQTIADLAQDAAVKARLKPQVDALYNYMVVQGGGISNGAYSGVTNSVTFAAKLVADAMSGSVDAIAEGTAQAAKENQPARIAHIFIGLLGRAAEKDGFDFWLNNLNQTTIEAVANDFFTQDEWRAIQPNPAVNAQTNDQLINRVFNNLVGRAPTSDERTLWTARLNAAPSSANYISRGAFVVQLSDQIANYMGSDNSKLLDRGNLYNKTVISLGFAQMPQLSQDVPTLIAVGQAILSGISPNATVANTVSQVMLYVQAMKSSAAGYSGAATAGALATPRENAQLQLARLYAAVLNRAPDNTGFNYWLNQLTSGTSSFEAVANNMLQGEGAAAYPASLSPADFVQKIYQTAFGVPATSHQLIQWTDALASKTRGAVVLDILTAAIGGGIFVDQNGVGYLNSKVGVGLTYALNAGGNDLAEAAKVTGLVSNTGGTVDISAAMKEVYNNTAALMLANAVATANAANSAATLTSNALAAAQTLSAANSSVDSATTAAAKVPMASYALRAAQLYAAFLNRGAAGVDGLDLSGFINMSKGLMNGTSDAAAAQGMIDSNPEGQKLFPLAMTGAAFVSALWRQMTTSTQSPSGVPLSAADQATWTAMASSRGQFGATAIAMLNKLLLVQRSDINADPSNPAELSARQGFDTRLANLLNGLRTQADSAATLAVTALNAANDAQNKASAATLAANAVTAARAAASGSNSSYVLDVARLYVGILNRGTGNMPNGTARAGLDYTGMLGSALADKQGYSLAVRAQNFIDSSEGQKFFGGGAYGPVLSNQQFVDKIFMQVLGRPAAATNVWLSALNGGQSRGAIASGIILDITENTVQQASEFDAAAAFDQRVADALTAFNNDPATAAGIAKSSSDVTAASTKLSNANTTLQNTPNPTSAPAVVAAQQAKDYLASPNTANLIKLLVGFGRPADYNTVVNYVEQMKAGTATFASISAGFSLPITDLAAFYRNLFSQILHRDPQPSGLDGWVSSTRQQQQNGNPNYSNAGFLAYDFFTACQAELYGTAASFPTRVRSNFPGEVSAVQTPDNNQASALAAGYDTALANAQQALVSRPHYGHPFFKCPKTPFF
ncbi:DUF4214 domain-containing protein [Duganella radicis]|uniref:DUF4214 domain-containing protein n=1 Tax=Duganella radicis TaxID=551988 RepID=UPI001478CC95|nr:DUF4214 domain-containing protein [Duganella radicis]